MHTHEVISNPKIGLNKKYTEAAIPQTKILHINCLNDSPKNIPINIVTYFFINFYFHINYLSISFLLGLI